MKLLKFLSNKSLSILLSFLFFQNSYSIEPADIWNIEKQPKEEKIDSTEIIETESILTNSIYEIQSKKKNLKEINESESLLSKDINIIGIYDPSDNDLTIDMWTNSDGLKILEIMNRIQSLNLSEDANNILNITLLTNSYYPTNNIDNKQFLKIKSDWLLKQQNVDLIETYLMKNKSLVNESNLIKYYVDYHLSSSDLGKACEIFEKFNLIIKDNYLSKFKIYCLINLNKKDEAQLHFDLLKEIGFVDVFFEQKFAYLMGYVENNTNDISEKSLLDFHLSHRTNSKFKFEPNINTSKLIWNYLSSLNLLEGVDFIDIEDREKIFTIEQATHHKNYKEEELFSLYENFVFDIYQLLNVSEIYKLLPKSESRALLYQGILLTEDSSKKIQLIKLLKDSFNKDSIPNAFDDKLSEFLKEIDVIEIPSNYTSFYESNLKYNNKQNKKIKFNNKIIHQSKLLNYFEQDSSRNNVEKDLENVLESISKKIKKDLQSCKKLKLEDLGYSCSDLDNQRISMKDIILLDSLKADGIQIPEKYENIYEVKETKIPYDIQTLLDNHEIGLVLLRLAEIVGEDEIIEMETEKLYLIISTLNQLNIDKLRNKILLKVLPLKV